MKVLKFYALIAMFTLGLGISAAQTVAHINSEEILMTYPAMISANKKIEATIKNHDAEINKMGKQYQAKLQALQKDMKAQTITEEQYKVKAQAIADLEKRIGTYRASAAKDIEKKNKTYFAPIYKKVEAAISAVAKEKRIKYVFDASPGRGLLYEDGFDLGPAVKAHLGIK